VVSHLKEFIFIFMASPEYVKDYGERIGRNFDAVPGVEELWESEQDKPLGARTKAERQEYSMSKTGRETMKTVGKLR
jgi:hypothetical protein